MTVYNIAKNDIKCQVKKEYPVLVNRKRVIATGEDKANITDFRWTRPKVIPQGFVEKRNAKGDFLYYTLTRVRNDTGLKRRGYFRDR